MRRRVMLGLCLGTGMLLAAAFPGHCSDVAKKTTQHAVIVTTAADWTSGAHSVATVDPVGGPRTIQNDLLPTISDINVAAFGKYFYRIERYNADNITKFHIDRPNTPIWQFSTMDASDLVTSSPHDMIFVSPKKAYVPRNNSPRAWIVNPSAKNESQFKIGELDLSAYADPDGDPEMKYGCIVDGKLFLVVQRVDSSNWAPSYTPYLAVFDIKTDKEIDTGKGEDGLLGIPLPIKYPRGIQYLKSNNKIYICGHGAKPGAGKPEYEYTGGIITVDPKTYKVKMILDDGDLASHPYGAFYGMAIVSKSKGYVAGWGSSVEDMTLYKFNPTTGKVKGPVDPMLSNIGIAMYDSPNPQFDRNKMLWVPDVTNAKVVILNTKTDEVDETISTNLNPARVVFVNH